MRITRFIAIVCTALVFGLTLTHVLQAPGSKSLPPHTWLDVQHTFSGGFAIVGGFAEIVGMFACLLLAVLVWRQDRRTTAAARFWPWGVPALAGLGLFGTLISYWVGNRPVNALVASWTADTVPADWPTYRASWENARAVSAALSSAAFLLLLAQTVWSPRRPGS